MPGFVLHQGAQVICQHGGQAMPTVVNPRVKVSGMPITTMLPLYSVVGCPQNPPVGPPCVTAQWTTASTKVRAGGDAVLLLDSQAITTPNGVPLVVLSTQTRVQAQ
jgi:hypothetical protein